jgi:Flp pilus assembly protein TadD
MSPLKLLIATAVSVSATPALACDDAQLQYAEEALAADRLLQSERMIGALQAACVAEERYARLVGRWALRAGRHEQAFAVFSALLQNQPADPEILSGAGRAAFNLARYGEALDLLSRAAALPGADWRTWNALAVLHDRRGTWADSAEAYRQALALSQDQAAIWNNRGYSMMLQRRFPEAASDLDRAVALDANNQVFRTNRDLAHAMAGRFGARRSGENAREWARRLNNMGYAAWLAGNREAARSLLARAIEASDVAMARAEHNLALADGSAD